MTSISDHPGPQARPLDLALAREAALREVLGVISRSRDDERPVFDVIVERAAALCHTPDVRLHIVEPSGASIRLAAMHGRTLSSFRIGDSNALDRPGPVSTAIATRRTVALDNLADDTLFARDDPIRARLVEEEGIRSYLAVPLVHDDRAIGAITVSRRELRPFTPDEITVVETFAAQAVIAIENVNQFREVQTRLERETASAEVLGVISRSRDDEIPVFDAILERAARLCQAQSAGLQLLNETGSHVRYVRGWGLGGGAFEPGFEMAMDGRNQIPEAIRTGKVINIPDTKDTDLYREGYPARRRLVDEEGIRSWLIVPLISDGQGFGALTLSRHEVNPFTPDQIALVETFAAQAVIAIENVRQFREVQERLEREKASAEVLDLISRSRDDELPVFYTILENAAGLCHAPFACLFMANPERTLMTIPAYHGTRSTFVELINRDPLPLDPEQSINARAVLEKRTMQVADFREDPVYHSGQRHRVHAVEVEGIRTVMVVPLVIGDLGIGTICLYRREVAPFSDDEERLVESFARQAVIAIENVRQFREVQKRLERERASAEILHAISQNRDDEQPVFDMILENAARLCKAPHAFLQLRSADDSHLEVAAQNFAASKFLELLRVNPIPIHDNDGSISVRGMNAATPTQYDDIRILHGTDLYTAQLGYAMDTEGMRTALFVPLISEGAGIGVIVLYKLEVAPFTEDEIALVETFAAQAVIAIENVRQFKALEKLNAELGDRVEEQVGELERLGRLKRFLSPAVADAVITSGSDKLLKSHRALIAALFADIRGFTAFCERAEPEETIEVLQTYHEAMGALIAAHGAGVDTRAGDGIMVLFNDPSPATTPPRMPSASRWRCATGWPGCATTGASSATGWASAAASRSATPPSASSAPKVASTTPPAAPR